MRTLHLPILLDGFSMQGLARHWFLGARTGEFWPVADPVRWCLASADHPLLERARDRLVTLTGDQEDRITRLVVRRCGLHRIDLAPGLVAHYWSRLADLKPFCRRFDLARPDVRVVLVERKHEVVTLTTGSEFLYGTALADTFPVERYWQKWRNRYFEEPGDAEGAGHSPTNYIWKDCEPGLVPWRALKCLWRTQASPFCGNCGLRMFVIWFEWF